MAYTKQQAEWSRYGMLASVIVSAMTGKSIPPMDFTPFRNDLKEPIDEMERARLIASLPRVEIVAKENGKEESP